MKLKLCFALLAATFIINCGEDTTAVTAANESLESDGVEIIENKAPLEHKIVESDEVGLEEYESYVDEMDLLLIPTKNRVFTMGATAYYSGQISSDFMYERDSIQESHSMPSHIVTFTKNIYMKRTEVTCGEFAEILNENIAEFDINTFELASGGYNSTLSYAGKEIYSDKNAATTIGYFFIDEKDRQEFFVIQNNSKFAANNITWYGAVYFCNKLSEKHGLEKVYDVSNNWKADLSKNGFRLPTEAEWEYACKAGSETLFFWGEIDQIEKSYYYVSEYYGNVSTNMPNDFGLKDMIGNVAEWCHDYYGPYSAETQLDPKGPKFDDIEAPSTSSDDTEFYGFVKRGGAFSVNGIELLSTTRSGDSSYDARTGFRYVLPVMK